MKCENCLEREATQFIEWLEEDCNDGEYNKFGANVCDLCGAELEKRIKERHLFYRKTPLHK